MEIPVQRWNLSNSPFGTQGSITQSAYMSPNPGGDWCRYDEVVRAIEAALQELVARKAQPTSSTLICQLKIPIKGTKPQADTYCTLNLGHEGDCK